MTYFEGLEQERCFEVSSIGRVDGSNYRVRHAVLSSLEKDFRMNDWRRTHSCRELADVYCKSKIVVNIGRDDYPSDVSLRFAEAMAGGALFVTLMPCEMTVMGFTEGVHFVGFRQQADLAPLLTKYLADEPTRKRIAEAGYEKVLCEHTYDVRVKRMLERVAQDNAKLQAPARHWSESRICRIYLDYFAANGALEQALEELPKIVRHSPTDALIGAALVGRAWSKRLSTKLRSRGKTG
jgi:hypothetical protein